MKTNSPSSLSHLANRAMGDPSAKALALSSFRQLANAAHEDGNRREPPMLGMKESKNSDKRSPCELKDDVSKFIADEISSMGAISAHDEIHQVEGLAMNDDFRLKLIKMRDEKVAHRDELQSMKRHGLSAKWVDEGLDIDGMIAREQQAIDNLDDTIARLS